MSCYSGTGPGQRAPPATGGARVAAEAGYGWCGGGGCEDGGVDGIAEVLAELDRATDGLVAGVQGLTDSEAREASLLPGWSRGHVLTHLARNAEGGTRLLVWARTEHPSYEYRSVAARAQAIEDGARRPAKELREDVQRTAEALREAATAMPPDAWRHKVTWTTGQETKAEHVPESRLAEVLLHHVDLNRGYSPSDWPAGWTAWMLDRAVQGLNDERNLAPLTADLHATDTGREFHLDGPPAAATHIGGKEAGILAWLMGRTTGTGLIRDGPGPLPVVPSIYYT